MAEKQTQLASQETTAVAVVPVTALEAMERANIDIQISTAKKYPRSIEKFYEKAEEMIALDQETADSCMYCRPVGKDDRGKMKYAEGMSIRLAEIVASCFGNLRVAGLITEMSPRHVKAIGMAQDLENNYAVKAEAVEATVKRTGQPYSERQRALMAAVAQSKAIRNAIFRLVPKSICKRLENKAKLVAQGDAKTFEDWRTNVVEWIEGLKIKPARVWAAIDVEGAADIGKKKLALLGGLKTAISEGDTTVDEAFPPLEGEEPTGKTTERIKEQLAKPEGPAAEPEPAPEKPKSKRGRPKKDKAAETEPKKESAVGAEPASPAAGDAQVPAPSTPEPEPEPEPEAPDKYKCGRCDRTCKVLVNDKCPFCFGEVTEIK